jgi:hypothetical protein
MKMATDPKPVAIQATATQYELLIGSNGSIDVNQIGQFPKGATPWSATATSATNAVAVATVAAVALKKHYLLGYAVALRAAVTAADTLVTVKDDVTVKLTDVFGAAAPIGTRLTLSCAMPIVVGTINKALTLNAAAGGAGAITELVMWGYTL